MLLGRNQLRPSFPKIYSCPCPCCTCHPCCWVGTSSVPSNCWAHYYPHNNCSHNQTSCESILPQDLLL